MKYTHPHAYFITFTCYGARLHGDSRGTADRETNIYETPFVQKNDVRKRYAKYRMRSTQYLLCAKKRNISLTSILEASHYYDWELLAVHIRTNHIHLVIKPHQEAGIMMNKVKCAISRRLNLAFPHERNRKKWTRHGSTRNLWVPSVTIAAMRYVIHEQGKPMAFYINPAYEAEMSSAPLRSRL